MPVDIAFRVLFVIVAFLALLLMTAGTPTNQLKRVGDGTAVGAPTFFESSECFTLWGRKALCKDREVNLSMSDMWAKCMGRAHRFKAAQAFAILSIVGLAISCALGIVLVFVMTTGLHLAAFIFTVLSAVFAVYPWLFTMSSMLYSHGCQRLNTSYRYDSGFGLLCAGWVLSMVNCIFIFLSSWRVWFDNPCCGPASCCCGEDADAAADGYYKWGSHYEYRGGLLDSNSGHNLNSLDSFFSDEPSLHTVASSRGRGPVARDASGASGAYVNTLDPAAARHSKAGMTSVGSLNLSINLPHNTASRTSRTAARSLSPDSYNIAIRRAAAANGVSCFAIDHSSTGFSTHRGETGIYKKRGHAGSSSSNDSSHNGAYTTSSTETSTETATETDDEYAFRPRAYGNARSNSRAYGNVPTKTNSRANDWRAGEGRNRSSSQRQSSNIYCMSDVSDVDEL